MRAHASIITLLAQLFIVYGSTYIPIYEVLNASPCIRNLDVNGVYGCTSPQEAASGSLVLVENQNDVAYVQNNYQEKGWAAVLSPEMFNWTIINTLVSTGNLNGILVLHGVPASSGMSPERPFPNKNWGLHSDSSFEWNPTGDSSLWREMPVPMSLLSAEDSVLVRDRSRENKESSYPRWAVDFQSFMSAGRDSATCLRRSTCQPVGGKSLWASLDPVDPAKEKVFGMANMDSTAHFHDFAVGGESTVSGLVGVLAAFQALTKVDRSAFKRDVIFALWAGESWDYMGSRKFLDDIQRFNCPPGNVDARGGCSQPYKTSLEFQNIKLDKIHSIIEFNQIGNGNKLYVHKEDTDKSNTADIFTGVANNASLRTTFSLVDNAANKLPGIPPSSLMSFLKAKPDINGIVITDHEAEYTNLNYHSHFDDGSNPSVAWESVADAATAMARTLYLLATDQDSATANVSHIVADPAVVRMLMSCFTGPLGFNMCYWVQKYLPLNGYALPANATFYPSIFGYTMYNQFISLPTKFLHDYFANTTATNITGTCTYDSDCSGAATCIEPGLCVESNIHYHDAISPGIDYDYTNDLFYVSDPSQNAWTESQWTVTAVRLFQQDSLTHERLFLGFGIVLTVAVFVTVFFVRRYILANFKIL